MDATTVSNARQGLGQRIWRATRPARIAVGLGAMSGLVAGGLGSRIVMRIIALADPSTEGAFTDAEATVGDFTLEGTANLMLAGTVAGVLGGLLYLGIRRWLPVPAKWNGVAFSVFTLVTVGNALFDPANADFQIFEPAVLVLGLFSLLFFVNGILLSRVMDRIHPEPAYTPRKRVTAVVTGVVAVVTLVGAFAFIGGSIGMIEDQGTCKSAVGAGGGCAVFSDP